MSPAGAVMVIIAEKSDHITLLREALESVGHTVILTTAYNHALDFLAHNKADIASIVSWSGPIYDYS